MDNSLLLVTSRQFNGVALDCYVEPHNNSGDFWATREQIGQLLGYAEPTTAIKNIHKRNQERLNRFSTQLKLSQVEGNRTVSREVTVYNFKGLLEICRYSQQDNANKVIDILWDVADEIRRTGAYAPKDYSSGIPKGTMEATKLILEAAHIQDNQLALALDKVAKHYTGYSLLALSGVALEAPTKHQILTPTEIGEYLGGLSAIRVNKMLASAGFQHKINGKWEPLGDGLRYGVMLDTNKRHSDGTPVRQLKWNSDILNVFPHIGG